MYGTQTSCVGITLRPGFENDVKMYGTQTVSSVITYDMAEIRRGFQKRKNL